MPESSLTSMPATTITCVATGLLALYVLFICIYRIFFHPLASFSGPLLGKFTEYDSWGSILSQDRSLKQFRLLKKYGSPVRVSTNTLVFSDESSWSDIYGQSSQPCLKDPSLYGVLSVTGATNILNAIDRHEHSRIRRLLSHSFSERSLLESEPLIAEKVQNYIDLVFGSVAPGETIEILRKTHDHYLDIVSHLSFGEAFNCLEGENPTAFEDLNEFSNALIPTALFAQTFVPAMTFLLLPWLRKNFQGLARLENFSRRSTEMYKRQVDEKSPLDMSRTFLKNLISAEDAETGTKLSTDELVENAIIFLRAGSGTTAVSTLYCIWACGKHPAVMKKLQAEIRTAFPNTSKMPTYEEASKLEYLHCVIEETLRLHGTLNVGLPRVSPGRSISGHHIPSGTVVQTNPYATARDPSVFPAPDSFLPERWLSASVEMKAMSRPFSYGPRNCIGRHLAQIGLVLTLCRLYQLFDVGIDAKTTDEMMVPKDIGVLEPSGEGFMWLLDLRAKNASGCGRLKDYIPV